MKLFIDFFFLRTKLLKTYDYGLLISKSFFNLVHHQDLQRVRDEVINCKIS